MRWQLDLPKGIGAAFAYGPSNVTPHGRELPYERLVTYCFLYINNDERQVVGQGMAMLNPADVCDFDLARYIACRRALKPYEKAYEKAMQNKAVAAEKDLQAA
jgi:hypothetical protein